MANSTGRDDPEARVGSSTADELGDGVASNCPNCLEPMTAVVVGWYCGACDIMVQTH
jgi:hypothetical protein